jgi:hypothetical protein
MRRRQRDSFRPQRFVATLRYFSLVDSFRFSSSRSFTRARWAARSGLGVAREIKLQVCYAGPMMRLSLSVVLLGGIACGGSEPPSTGQPAATQPAAAGPAAAPGPAAEPAEPAAAEPASDAQRFVLELIATLKADDADRWRGNLSARLHGRSADQVRTQMAAWKELEAKEAAVRSASCREESQNSILRVVCDVSPEPIKITVVRESGALRLDEN